MIDDDTLNNIYAMAMKLSINKQFPKPIKVELTKPAKIKR